MNHKELAALLENMTSEQRVRCLRENGMEWMENPCNRGRRQDGFRSQLEADYAVHLETLKAGGNIREWWYEPMRLKIASGKMQAWYKPDFAAILVGEDGETDLFFYEVKGYWREAARLRIKVAAGLYKPFWFVAITRKDGQWVEENFSVDMRNPF